MSNLAVLAIDAFVSQRLILLLKEKVRGKAMTKTRLRQIRLERGLSQLQLSFLSKVPNCAICEFELGKRQLWPKARRALAEVLKVPEAELFGNNK